MADNPQPQETTETPTPVHRTDIEPVCDEDMGGGGSNPDTRFRGMPGGWPGGPLDEDCAPTARGEPAHGEPDGAETPDQPTPDGKRP
ncbi:hypothetical protein [Azospirillum rugosum]|uniref:Uncharacterized protein n=1 Tax=Azospirillum rugosum TaxID=416170 RepID=A0ABS4SRE0_9PROT|nr:hypothetical protein [Azospirillum rugosum]MBP2295136.1 hypothetical protein [Azospirillum rugosum]MDQ0528510.1 hypothetical protein [Azospirillum rugosum]